MLFSILRFAHFAHGDMMTLAAYLALPFVAGLGLHPLAGAALAAVITSAAALGIDHFAYRPVRARPTIVSVLISLGVALMLRSAVQLTFGVQIESYTQGLIVRPLRFGQFIIAEKHIWIVACAVVLMIAVHLLLSRTKAGKAMRAMSDSPELARLRGIPTERVIRTVWVVGACLASVAGVFAAWDTQLQTMIGWNLLLPIFAATILGGIGRPYGAMLGGLVIGMAEELSTYPWLGTEPLLSPGYKTGVAFAIMVLLLIVRPHGLFKGRQF
jgi:branched-subunit amino acid ABC-type transport system permease component